MKIDMHMHSTSSDGTFTVPEIVGYAKKENYDLISVTDHNSFKSADILKNSVGSSKPLALAGIELSTKHNGKKLHLLGYFGINNDFTGEKFAPLLSVLKREDEAKKIQVKQIIDNLSADFDVSYDEFMRFTNDNGFINRVHIARYLTDKGITLSVSDAFNTVINTKSKYFSKRQEMSFEEGINAIVLCGGMPSIAHFIEYSFDDEEIDEIAQIASGVTDTVGVELWHYKQNAEFRNLIIERCKKYNDVNICFTAGSDFHGANKVQSIGEISPDNFTDSEQAFFDEQMKRTMLILENKGLLKKM